MNEIKPLKMPDKNTSKSALSAVNTILILTLSAITTILGISLNRNLASLDRSIEGVQRQLDNMLPRREMEIILQGIRDREGERDTKLAEIRLRVAAIEGDNRTRGVKTP